MVTALMKVLVVEDSADDAELMISTLKLAGFDLEWTLVQTEFDYREKLQQEFDLILSDFTLPTFSAKMALNILKESKLSIPFIVVSGTIGEEQAVETLKAGATDYVLKSRLGRLIPTIERALREHQDRIARSRLESQFIEAQKMEVVGHLAGGIAHDFNNILGVIIGYADLILAEVASDNVLHEPAEEIRQAAERAVALTRQLLIFSRKQAVQAAVLDLNQVIESLDKMLRRLIDENIGLTIVPAKALDKIKADAGQIGQVLLNLVVNARDAMPNGGKLKIETSNIRLFEKPANLHGDASFGDYVLLTVSDTGIGMNDETKKRLFEVFFTTKPKGKGTGLGLVTCKTIVAQYGGCIEVQSELNRGTTFKVYFPKVDPILETTFIRKPEPKPIVRGTETLLLVEDDPSVRQLASSVLTSHGYNVLRANNGQEGLRVAREFKGGLIQLVITDVVMPQMSGPVMAEWLQATYPSIKILFTSGYTDEAIAQHGVLEPGVAFLPKPYTPVALAQKVRELLDEKNPSVS